MRKIYVKGSVGYCGTNFAEVIEVEDDTSDEDINHIAYDLALENAQTYGYEEHCCGIDCEEEDCGEGWSSEELDYGWEDYNAEKYEGTY